MRYIFVLSLVATIFISGCNFTNEGQTITAEIDTAPQVEGSPQIKSENIYVDESYLAQTYGFNISLPNGYSVNQGDKDGEVWIGPDSDFWMDGFYIRPVENWEARISEVKSNVVEIVEEDEEIAVGNVNAYKVTVGWDTGYEVTYYFVESPMGAFEIQLATANEVAQNAITETLFVPEFAD